MTPSRLQPVGAAPRTLPECVAHLNVLFAFVRELLRYEAAWLAGVPYWDAKRQIGTHLLEDAGHAEALLTRLHELKASAAEHRTFEPVQSLAREIASAAHGDEWLHGLYGDVKPWLVDQFRAYLASSDPLMDAPSRRAIERIIAELERQAAWFRDYSPAYSGWEYGDVSAWSSYVRNRLAAAPLSPEPSSPAAVARPAGHPDFAGIATVRRDRNFRLARSRAETPPEGTTFQDRRFLVFYNHTQEMQFAESLGAILYETPEMPWAFHHDLARHIADEVRHAVMGQTRLEQLGVSLAEVPMMTQHYEFRSNLNPVERFALMTLVMEATAFERKRANVELFEAHQDAVSALYETYDIRDEMLHTNLGHLWVPILLRVYHDRRSVAEVVEHCRGLIAQVISEYPSNAANMVKR